MQLLSGFVLGLDQVMKNSQIKSAGALWEIFAKQRMRVSVLICMGASLVGILIWLATSGQYTVNPEIIVASFAAFAILYYPYIGAMSFITKIIEKEQSFPDPKVKDSSIFWGKRDFICSQATAKPDSLGDIATLGVGQWDLAVHRSIN